MLELIVLFAFCALLGLACFGAIGFVLLNAEDIGVEKIFLLHVWALLGLLFLGLAGWIARTPQLQVLWKAESPGTASPPQPAATAKPETAPEEAGKRAS